MGEAQYYAKIKFDSVEECNNAKDAIKEFFKEMTRADNFWQHNRGINFIRHADSTYNEFCGEKFWPEFEQRFPVVSDYLRNLELFGGDSNNALAGQMDVGFSEEEVEYGWNCNEDDDVILYSATVWHFAEWEPISDYIALKWNGHMTWLSDEYVDLYDLL